MIEWIKQLFSKGGKHVPTYGDIAKIESGAIVSKHELASRPVYDYKVYMKDNSKTVTVRANSFHEYPYLQSYWFQYKGTNIACFDKESVRYIKADLAGPSYDEV